MRFRQDVFQSWKYCERGKYKNERQAHYFRVADTDRLFIFINIIFPRKYSSDLSPLEKNTPTLYSRARERRNSRDVPDEKRK